MSESDSPPVEAIQALVPFAERLADAARAQTLACFRSPTLAVETKGDASPVTAADKGAEAAMRALIGTHCPDHGILGEEEGSVGLDRDFVWVLDPIDGTRSFVTGQPLWGTLIALAWRGRPVLGIVDAPAMNERWIGCEGLPTTHNGQPCRVRATAGPSAAIAYTSTPDLFSPAEHTAFDALSARLKDRRYCADCYAYGMVASGWIDIALDAGTQPYDYMALVPVVTGAGGAMTDWTGQPLSLTGSGWILAAATPALHGLAVADLAPAQPAP